MNINLIASEFMINIARGVFTLTLGMFLYSLSGSIAGFALTFVSEVIISIILRGVTGTIVDKLGVRKVLVFSCCFCALIILPVILIDRISNIESSDSAGALFIAVLITLLFNLVRPFITVSCYSAVIHYSPNQIQRQNSWLSIALQSGQLVGIGLAGIILEISTIGVVCLVVSLCYAFSAISYALLKISDAEDKKTSGNINKKPARKEKQSIINYIRKNPQVSLYNFISAVDFSLVGVFTILIAPVVAEHFNNQARWLSILDLNFTIGSILCSVLLTSLFTRLRVGKLIPFVSNFTAILAFWCMFKSQGWLMYVAIFSFGFSVNLSYIFWTSESQKKLVNESSGHAGSLKYVLNSFMMAFAAFFITLIQYFFPYWLMYAVILYTSFAFIFTATLLGGIEKKNPQNSLELNV